MCLVGGYYMEVLKEIRHQLYILSDDGTDDSKIDLCKVLINKFITEVINKPYELETLKSDFNNIININEELGLRTLFFIRDPKGLGRRREFRILINHLAILQKDLVIHNLHNITKYGRFDDLYSLMDTPVETNVFNYFKEQLIKDSKSTHPSLLCKWLKSENCSSLESKRLATKTRKALGLSSKEYRILLSSLRKKINIFENTLRTKEITNIKYTNITVGNYIKYKNWFIRNDKERYITYIKNSTKKLDHISIINLISKYIEIQNNTVAVDDFLKTIIDSFKIKLTLNDLIVFNFNSEPTDSYNKCELSVALYLHLLNNYSGLNLLSDCYMHLSSSKTAKFSRFQAENCSINSIYHSQYYYTNKIDCYLELLLYTAVKKSFKSSDIPSRILIISDNIIEFSNIDKIQHMFQTSNYKMPQIVIYYPKSEEQGNESALTNKNILVIRNFNSQVIDSIIEKKFIKHKENILETIMSNRYNIEQ